MIIGLICLVCGALVIAGAAFFLRSAKTVSPATTSSPVATPATPAQPTIPKVEPAPDLWNGLKPGAVAIQKPDKGRLIYAVGSIRNDSDKQRYGVKVTLDVLDANGEKIGSAVDQTQFIDAHKEWNYKALVTSSKAKSAKVAAITED